MDILVKIKMNRSYLKLIRKMCTNKNSRSFSISNTWEKLGKKSISSSVGGKYYDSQSGLFINTLNSEYKYHLSKMNLEDEKSISSFSKQFAQLANKSSIASVSIPFEIIALAQNLLSEKSSIVISIPIISLHHLEAVQTNAFILERVNDLQAEYRFVPTGSKVKPSDLALIQKCIFSNKRVSLLIDLTKICITNEAQLLSDWDLIDNVAHLCDQGISVIDLKLCCSNEYWSEIAGPIFFFTIINLFMILYFDILLFHFIIDLKGHLITEATDLVVDYVRDVLEACIGLDVEGDPVKGRLSLSGLHCEELITMADSLGIKRYSVILSGHSDSNSLDIALGSQGGDKAVALVYRDPEINFVRSILNHNK